MFRLFRPTQFCDPTLGPLERARGRWRGKVLVDGKQLPLALVGGRDQPDAEALAVAKQLPIIWRSCQESVKRSLVEHLEPYLEALGEDARATDLWQFVALISASVVPLGGKLVAEIALSSSWDEEHVLGARFDGPKFVELNGSIVPE